MTIYTGSIPYGANIMAESYDRIKGWVKAAQPNSCYELKVIARSIVAIPLHFLNATLIGFSMLIYDLALGIFCLLANCFAVCFQELEILKELGQRSGSHFYSMGIVVSQIIKNLFTMIIPPLCYSSDREESEDMLRVLIQAPGVTHTQETIQIQLSDSTNPLTIQIISNIVLLT